MARVRLTRPENDVYMEVIREAVEKDICVSNLRIVRDVGLALDGAGLERRHRYSEMLKAVERRRPKIEREL